nr:sesquiterpene synthase [Trametes versicolor]
MVAEVLPSPANPFLVYANGVSPILPTSLSHIDGHVYRSGSNDSNGLSRLLVTGPQGLPPAITPEAIQEMKAIMQDFLQQCNYEDPSTPKDIELRERMALEMAAWSLDLPATFIEQVHETSCHFIETAYVHTTLEHRFFVARYCAYFLYADDLPGRCLDALIQFPRRFANREQQLDPILNRLAEMIRGAHELWTDVGASAIIAGTLDALTAFYIEYTTCGLAVKPQAVRYPYYLRLKSGIDPPFVAFIFMRGWRDTAESYVQMLPEIEYWIGATNDLLSFYKEELAQETNNYIHIRAAMEQTTGLVILRKLADEILDTTRRIEGLAAEDAELAALWHGYKQGFLEFQIKAPRYRLSDLGLTE